MSILLKEFQEYTQPDIKLLQRKVMKTFSDLDKKLTIIKYNQRQLICSLLFKHSKRHEIQIQTYWTFSLKQEMIILIELTPNSSFSSPDEKVSSTELLLQMNRDIINGSYFFLSQSPILLKFRTHVSLITMRLYLTSILSQIYQQVQTHFIFWATQLRLLGEFCEPMSNQIHKNLILISKLKEYIQLERQKRKKATSYYDLTSCSIKTINEALVIINCNFGLLKNYKNGIKMDRRRRQECQSAFRHCLIKYKKYQVTQSIPIVRGIEIRKVIAEEKLDETNFSIVYRGIYEITTNCTVNPQLLTQEDLKNSNFDAKCELVKKLALSPNAQDINFRNQIDFLKFMRMKRSSYIAEYYMTLTAQGEPINQCIYSKYCPSTLYRKYFQWDVLRLLRASLQIAQGIMFLNNHRILHRDLKETNILVDGAGNIKIIDFGSTSGIYGNNLSDFPCSSAKLASTQPYFLPFKAIKQQYKFIEKNYQKLEFEQCSTFDIYSFGVILSNLFNLQKTIDSIIHRQIDFISKKCRQINPEDRPRPQQVVILITEAIHLLLSQKPSGDEDFKKSNIIAQP